MTPKFIHLRLHSAYSLAEGAIKIEQLTHLCEEDNMPAVAVTDSNNLFGAMEFSMKCADHGIQPIIGCQLNVQHSKKLDRPTSILLYAQSQSGYQNMIQLISNSYLHSSSELFPEVPLDLLGQYSDDLILTTGGMFGSLGALLYEKDTDGAKEYLSFLQKHFDNRIYIELSRHNKEAERKIEADAISLAEDFNIPLVATNNVCFSHPDDFNAHDALICISQGKTIYDTERETSCPEFYFKSQEEMCNLFYDIPEALSNSVNIAKRCHFMLTKQKPHMPLFKPESGNTQEKELRIMANEGLEFRLQKLKDQPDFDKIRPQYFERLEYELGIIETMGFSGYFLIVADYVRWAKSQSIPVGPGRGSGAGSIVAWSIKITDIDPIRFKLFFERFLNPDRVSMPDFDIDFCQERREEVIAYVQRKYGWQSVAQIITFGKLQAKAVVRDIGRVLALSYGFVDKISKMIPFQPTNPMTLQQAIDSEQQLRNLIESDPQVKGLMEIALKLEGLYRNPGVHAAGVVISDKNLQDVVPLYKDARSTMPTTQFSMKYVESASLIKFDFLGLKTLTVIQKALDLIKNRGIDIKSQDIPLDDKKTFDLLKAINCVGVFQIESGGMRDVLKKMQPDRIEDLIALVALYRPGPMDDIPRYIACKHGEEPITYLHEKVKPILEETYGVMVYQEQVMQIAQVVSGYTLGQADILRRAMGKKNKEEMVAQRKRFIDGAIERGVTKDIAEKLFNVMEKFASYGFNKSHSTPYGVLTYQTAYLKANYPIEFFAAIMTLDMTNTDKLYTYYQDANINGITILAPDINRSGHEFLIDYSTNSIIYSLSAIKGSGAQIVKEIEKERNENGAFLSIFDFAERLAPKKLLNRRFLENFIKAGAFDKLHPNRKQLFDSLDDVLSMKVSTEQAFLFEKSYPELRVTNEWPETEKLQYEFAAIGFYLSAHPMSQYASLLKTLRFPSLIEAKNLAKTKVAVIINSVSFKITKSQNKMCILQVSDASGAVEITMFSEAVEQYRSLLEVGNIVVLNISCYKNDDQLRISADKVQKFDNNYSPMFEANLEKNGVFKPKAVHKTLEVKISNKSQLRSLKSLFDNFKKRGDFSIHLILSPNSEKLRLLDTYSLSSYDILDIRNVVGADNVKEIIAGKKND